MISIMGMQKESNLRNVFVVHGRNHEIRNAMFQFLRSIDLMPVEWEHAIRETGKASPYISEVLEAGFSMAQAAVILLTPDDEARLRESYWSTSEPQYETELTPQARPNVLFEAGIAMGMFPERTVLVEFGELRPFSDISGRHVIRMNNSTQKRQDLADRLETAGCLVSLKGRDWHTSGNFDFND
jgi:predicted nucleotide-binding protein